jgi:hypothetical protein
VTDTVSAATTPTFSPSELVVLFGDRFTPEAGMLAAKEEVLTSGVKVNAEKLMNAAMAAALFAVHRAGAARLELRQGKALFGLVKTRKLHLVRGTGASTFPAGSLESLLIDAAESGPEVQKILESYIGGESANPPQRALARMKAAMAQRGLLETSERKTMMVFTTLDFVLPEATKSAAEREPLEPVQALLREAEQREPELFREVQKDIDGARVMMTESRD